MNSISKLQAEVDQLQGQLSNMNFSEECSRLLKEQARSFQREVHGMRDKTENLSARLNRCNFHYTPPQPNFDKRRVYAIQCSSGDKSDQQVATSKRAVTNLYYYHTTKQD